MQEKENKFGNIICLEPENCSRLWIYPGCIGAYGSLRKREIGVGKSGRSKGLRPHQGLSLGEVGRQFYSTCWDWVGMYFKMVGMDPNRCAASLQTKRDICEDPPQSTI